ncbi:MAG: integration host factor subunit beta [Proteobacteria bacterium]|jgi:integration host factor subunit beta|nr:integration host factor subunit beta [Pseudomonadota bacterium]
MVKSELIESLAERADITLAKAEEIVDLFFDAVGDTLCNGHRVEIRGFGAFTVREYKAYEGRNPKTGERITVPPKRLPFWKTGMELKQRVDSAFPPTPVKASR